MERLEELRTDEETYLWFRKEGRVGRDDDYLGPFKFAGKDGNGMAQRISRYMESRVGVSNRARSWHHGISEMIYERIGDCN